MNQASQGDFFYREGPESFAATSKALRREQTAEWASHGFGDSSKGGVHTLKSFTAVAGTVGLSGQH